MVLSVTLRPPSQTLPLNNDTNNSFNPHRPLLHFLSQCSSMSQLKQIHAQTLRTTTTHHPNTLFLYSRILHCSSLFDLDYAFRVFDPIDNPNSFMWNTLIRGCAHSNDRKEQAILLYYEMLNEGSVVPDKHTFPFVLKACAYLFALFEGKEIHGHVLKLGFDSDVYINNSLVHFYATCGYLEHARIVFDNMSERSVVSWNVMIDAFVQLSEFELALKLFAQMQKLFKPDGYVMQSVLSACGNLGALSLGMWIHAYVLRKCDSDVASDVLVNNSLVDMYCKCGSLEIARQVFERMHTRDVTSWNSMILGLAMHGQVEAALEYFSRMVDEDRIMPNSITFVGVLSACNHRGMVGEGRKYFDLMITKYKIKPVLEHYGCLVDLLARAGFIDDALELVSNMPVKPDVVIWRSLLDACCKKNVGVELSEEVARQVIESEGGICSGVYVLLSKVYASASRWNEVLDVIEERLGSIGYEADFSQAPMVDELNDGKQHSLELHSERLAIAFGLLNLKPGMPIRIFKNLRVM
ncbi:hypothetical protein F0562_033718 [Nyssa sinensis]|uniref:DYW domain-containing protein n=1 Tax=Nyssa sinensis TaxID=561372 RepID=A0A5J5AEQ6_9ASTE|nr:hypothetical protein F0562_033718 [Nyssa sinensis]